MPRFHFNVENRSREQDEEGTVLPSLAEAKCEAVRYAGRLICDEASEFWDTGEFVMTVTDDQGLALFSLHFNAVEAPAMRISR